jgi:hypothetical protein
MWGVIARVLLLALVAGAQGACTRPLPGGGTGDAGAPGRGGTTGGGGTGGTTGTGGAIGTGGGPGGSTGSAGTSGTGTFGTPSCTVTAQGLEPVHGQACAPGDPEFCYRTCGPEKIGVKSETCVLHGNSGEYAEMSGCSFDPARDYSCYKIPSTANVACPAGVTPMASAACDVPPCMLCNSTGGLYGGQYFDANGANKLGFCVCQAPSANGARTWSCASDTAWPCPLANGCGVGGSGGAQGGAGGTTGGGGSTGGSAATSGTGQAGNGNDGGAVAGAGGCGIDPSAPRWTQTYGTPMDEYIVLRSSFQATSDGTYVVAGQIDPLGGRDVGHGYIVKFAPTGLRIWEKTYGGSTTADGFNGVAAAFDGLIACGYTTSGNAGCTAARYCSFCVRTDLWGNEMWRAALGGAVNDIAQVYGVVPTASGILYVGTTTDGDPWLNPLTGLVNGSGFSDGISFGKPGEDILFDLRAANDGTFYASGYTNGFGSCQQPWIFHLAENGTRLGEYSMAPCLDESSGPLDDKRGKALAVLPQPDGSLIVSGHQNTPANKQDAFVAKIVNFDTAPSEAWRSLFGGTEDDKFSAVESLPDGGFLLIGYTASFGAGGHDVYAVRTDASGNELWHKTYGGAGDDEGVGLLKGADGSYLIAGWTSSSGAGGRDIQVIALPAVCP